MMAIFYTNDIGTFFDQMLLEHIKRGENDKVLAILRHEDPRRLASSLGTTLLHFAAKYSNIQFMQYLIELGMAVDVQNRFGETPLMFALMFQQLDAVKLLLKCNADPLLPDISGQCTLGRAVSFKKCFGENIVRALLDSVTVKSLSSSKYVKSQKFHGDCPLFHFISLGNAEITKILLKNGSPVDARSTRGETALHIAARFMNLENVKILLKFGADVNAKQVHGRTPLECIPITSNQAKAVAILKTLIGAGAMLIDRVSGLFMVRMALSYGNAEVVRAILNSDIDLQFIGAGGDTALHIIAKNREPNVIKEVQDIKSATKVVNQHGLTMLHVVVTTGRVNRVKYLVDNGADINARSNFGCTPLGLALIIFIQIAKRNGSLLEENLQYIEILLEHGAFPRLVPAGKFTEHSSSKHSLIALAEPVLAHLAVMEASGREIEESIHSEIEAFETYKIIFNSMKQQLKEMQQMKIGETVTLFDILTWTDKQVSQYARKKASTSNLTTEEVKERIVKSDYNRRLLKCIVKFIELVETRKKVMILVSEVFHRLYDISVEIIAEKIFNYLEDEKFCKNELDSYKKVVQKG